MVVGTGPVRAARHPARACPGDKETPWLWGECTAPALRRGHWPSPARSAGRRCQAACQRPWEGRWAPGAGHSVPAQQGRWDTFPRSATDQPACPSTAYSAASNPPPAPGQAPAPSSPQPWPGAQLGPGGQSYCKRPGRPKLWTLPAGRGRRHLPLPGSASQGRVLRPPSS